MKIIDFNVKKTEAGWIKSVDDFWLKFTPIFFRFLEWLIVVTVFHFIADRTKHKGVILLSGMSYISLALFIQSFLFNIEYKGVLFINSLNKRMIFSILMASIISILILIFVASIVNQLKEYI